MATPCPQGFTDVELPTTLLNAWVAADYATWDAEEGVHTLTPKGLAALRASGGGMLPSVSDNEHMA